MEADGGMAGKSRWGNSRQTGESRGCDCKNTENRVNVEKPHTNISETFVNRTTKGNYYQVSGNDDLPTGRWKIDGGNEVHVLQDDLWIESSLVACAGEVT